jgi:hypothetical protein
LLLSANALHTWKMACVVSDCWCRDSRMLEVTDDSETDTDTDAR